MIIRTIPSVKVIHLNRKINEFRAQDVLPATQCKDKASFSSLRNKQTGKQHIKVKKRKISGHLCNLLIFPESCLPFLWAHRLKLRCGCAKNFPRPLLQYQCAWQSKKKKYKLWPKYTVLVSQVGSQHCATSTLKFNQHCGVEGRQAGENKQADWQC